MRGWSRFAEEEAHHNCSRTAGNPEHCTSLKVQRQVWRGPGAPPDTIRVNWTHERCNRENEEIDSAGRTALHIVRVDFLDDAVGDHRGAGGNPEYEHSQLH